MTGGDQLRSWCVGKPQACRGVYSAGMLPDGGLWRHPEFLKLWTGQTISLLGSQVTFLALPLTAALVLQASPFQMGVLQAAQVAPFPLLGLVVGAFVDRRRRRPVLVMADLGRAVLLGFIPLLSLVGLLRMEALYVVAALVGVMTVFFEVAYQAYLPSLVRREDLVEGNSKLQGSLSVAQTVGPGLAGALIQVLTAPLAIVIDAFSFLASMLFLGLIRNSEPPPNTKSQRDNLWLEMAEGVRFLIGNPLLRPIAASTATGNLFYNLLFAVYVLYAMRELGIDPVWLGAIFAMLGVGGFMGALVAQRAAQRFGLGPTIIGAAFLGGMATLVVPLAAGPPSVAIPLLMLAWLVGGLTTVVYNVNQVSLRQAITPDRLQGRVSATFRVIVWGVSPIGAVVGGLLGEVIGLRGTLLVGAIGVFLEFAWVLFSPVRLLRQLPLRLVQPAETPA